MADAAQSLVATAVAVAALWVLTVVVGWRVVSRMRSRSREINAQIEGLHREIESLRRLQYLSSVEHALSEIFIASERGTLSAASRDLFIGHLQSLRDELRAAIDEGGRLSPSPDQ